VTGSEPAALGEIRASGNQMSAHCVIPR